MTDQAPCRRKEGCKYILACVAAGDCQDEEQVPSKDLSSSRFREHIPLELAGFKAEFFVNDIGQHVAIIREHTEGDIRLFVREARELRDWLNKVLP